MTTVGSFNSKNPTIKRILRESRELSSAPSRDFSAAPLESNLFEWHFTLRGPPGTPYAAGLYHGRIVLPASYPLRPPSFRFLTPSGRFEPNREICLSISGHHEESWQPAWGIRTALVAIRAFMEGDAKGQVGGIDAPSEVRERYARESISWRCPTCGKNNGEVAQEMEKAAEGSSSKEEAVPKELELQFKDEMTKAQSGGTAAVAPTTEGPQQQQQLQSPQRETASLAQPPTPLPIQPGPAQASGISSAVLRSPQGSQPTRTIAPQAVIRPARRREDETILNRLDMAIAVFAAGLIYMVVRKLASWT